MTSIIPNHFRAFWPTIIITAVLVVPCRAESSSGDRVETPDGAPPSDAIVLFDGQGTGLMLAKDGGPCGWPVDEEGALVSQASDARSNHIVSKFHFRDAQIHVEFQTPEKGPGNSGVYIHGLFELQIYNSADQKNLNKDMAGAIYGIAPPLVNAARRPGQWQTYDIIFIAPRHDEAGKVTRPGSITALLNGVLVQNNVPITESVSVYHPLRYKTTPYTDQIKQSLMQTGTGPLFLQDHDSPVRFRNVWVRPLDDQSRLFEAEPTQNE